MSAWPPGARGGLVASLALALGVPGVGSAHPVDTPAEHHAEDHVVHDAATEARLNKETKERSAVASKATAAPVPNDPAEVGRWGPVVDWPVVGIHVSLLPNGKVLAFDSVGDRATETFAAQDFTRATVYDPATGTHTPADVDTGFNVFCSGFAHLVDGSVFLAGGTKDSRLTGLPQTHLFDPATNDWRVGPSMAAGRWYPSVTPLTNLETLITEGGPDVPEVRRADGGLRALTTASLNLPLYPWLDVAPDGRVLYSGPDPTLRKLDPAGGGSWQSLGQRDALNRDYGSRAVYDVGKILVTGGGPSSKDARVIDVNGATPQVSATSPMAFGRRQHNVTVLADGSVLATGGNSTGAPLVDVNGGVYNAERWNPATGQWTTLAAQMVTRQYHSTALLLPDGRVLSSGGGVCGTCDQVGYLAKNAEVYTPPYLFRKDGSGHLAARPQITSAPGELPYDAPFAISTPDPASIGKVALARLDSVTHSVSMEQRYVPLSFTADGTAVEATSPATVDVAPPGFYMLFIVDNDGVPSTATMVQIGGRNRPPRAVATATPTSGTAPLPVDFDGTGSSDPDEGDTITYSWDLDGDRNFGDSTAATASFTYTASGTYTARLRVTDKSGASDTAAVTIDVGSTTPSPRCGGGLATALLLVGLCGAPYVVRRRGHPAPLVG